MPLVDLCPNLLDPLARLFDAIKMESPFSFVEFAAVDGHGRDFAVSGEYLLIVR